MAQSYTSSDINEADRLFDDHMLAEVSRKTGIPYSTLWKWKDKGMISTETDHHAGSLKYDDHMIERADYLYDRIPLSGVSEVTGVPETTLAGWKQRGLISTDVDWRARNGGVDKKVSPQRVAYFVYQKDMSHREAAEKLDVDRSTIHRNLKKYSTQ